MRTEENRRRDRTDLRTSWAGMKPINPIGKLLELDLWAFYVLFIKAFLAPTPPRLASPLFRGASAASPLTIQSSRSRRRRRSLLTILSVTIEHPIYLGAHNEFIEKAVSEP